MRASLIEVCRDLRMHNRFSRTQVAAKINRGEQVIQRFEDGSGRWNPQTGEIVAAYAELADVTVISVWTDAVNRMREALNVAPLDSPRSPDPAKDAARRAGDAARGELPQSDGKPRHAGDQS